MISKKTALVWVLVIAGLAAVWKWMSAPGDDAMVSKSEKSSTTEESKKLEQKVEDQSVELEVEAEEDFVVSTEKEYKTPAGSDRVEFSIAIDTDGVITNASATALSENEISKKRQMAFAEGIPAVITGKKLSDLSAIDTVGGSSLTTMAFNEALAELKLQAEEE